MYIGSLQWLRRMNYCNEAHGFINYALSNPINISGGGIRYPCKRCKNNKKISLSRCCNDASSIKKKFMKKYMCWYAHEEPYVPHDTMVKRMVGSTSRFSNTHRVVLDCSNPYKNMIMDAMRMNQDHVGQCPS